MARLKTPNFDRVARIYRAGEYLAFGPILERCRFFYLPEVSERRRALVLGDGDGRFLTRLLAEAPELHADAVDSSPAMLGLLRARVARTGAEGRLRTLCADARAFSPEGAYDLVVTHFFLDCLEEKELAGLMERVRPHLAAGARWVVSEFEVAEGPVRGLLTRALIAALYAGFRLLTGLRVSRIPEWRQALRRQGLVLRQSHRWLGGLLVAELWELQETGGDEATGEVAG